ncbi:MAG TPA: hypothetical protein PLJ35_21230 [Anaerolineae bacterium]|nr:hypothetical protein [Anaerolineae bacterium]HOR01346.1 hypothetical protein [Anaerolineae bacterium]HPL27999.1 hypothetical protein [Anaerolineae bacterium]
MASRRSRAYLAAMRLVERISAELGTTSYVWGGFALDVYEGRVLREHDDIDYLTVDLPALKPQLAGLFAAHGWPAKELSNGDLSPRRHGLKMQLGQIALGARVRWTYDGDRGYLEFPLAWLRPHPVRFCGLEVHVVEPELEYVTKCCPQLLNPDWRLREREIAARERLRALLWAKGVDPEALYARITLWREAP